MRGGFVRPPGARFRQTYGSFGCQTCAQLLAVADNLVRKPPRAPRQFGGTGLGMRRTPADRVRIRREVRVVEKMGARLAHMRQVYHKKRRDERTKPDQIQPFLLISK